MHEGRKDVLSGKHNMVIFLKKLSVMRTESRGKGGSAAGRSLWGIPCSWFFTPNIQDALGPGVLSFFRISLSLAIFKECFLHSATQLHSAPCTRGCGTREVRARASKLCSRPLGSLWITQRWQCLLRVLELSVPRWARPWVEGRKGGLWHK